MNWQSVTGYISPDLIKAGGEAWVNDWLHKAIQAEKNGNELVVFEIKSEDLVTTSESANDRRFNEPFI